MDVISVALAATYSAILSLRGIDTNGPVGFGLSVGQTAADTFNLYGTLDSAAVDNTNAFLIGSFSGGAQNLPKGIADEAKQWPYLLVQRTGGSTAGTFFVAGNPAANPSVVSVAAPAAVGDYSGLVTLTTLNAQTLRIGLGRQFTANDSFDVYLSNDAALASSSGTFAAGTITGGGGANINNTVLVSGYAYAILQRASGSTAGNILAAGVSPSSGGGTLDLTTLPVGNTAVNGNIGTPPLTAPQSVDIYSSFLLTQTTAGVTATLPAPTDTTAGHVALVMNATTATQAITMYGETIGVGAMQLFQWTGAAWVSGKNITQLGNAFGAAIVIGSTDAFNISLVRNSVTVFSDDGTTTVLGNTTAARAATVQSGTGGISIAATNGAVAITSGTGAISIGADAANHTITIGSVTGASPLALRSGTGALTFVNNGVTYTWPAAAPTINGQSLVFTTAGVGSFSGATNVGATKSTAQTITDGGGATPITGWTEQTDTANAFDPTAGTFTAPVAGFYTIAAAIEWAATAANLGATFQLGIAVNGSISANVTFTNPVAALAQVRGQTISRGIQLAANDVVSVRVQLAGAGGNIATTATASNNGFSVAKIG